MFYINKIRGDCKKAEGEKGRGGKRQKGKKAEGEKGRGGKRQKGKKAEGEKGRRKKKAEQIIFTILNNKSNFV